MILCWQCQKKIIAEFVPPGFTFIKSLQNGFLGHSYLLKKDDNNQQYLCKSFAKSSIGDENDVENFVNIIRFARAIKESCFLPYHYYYVQETHIYGIRPFFEGLNLTSYITSCSVDLNTAYAQWKVLVRLYRHLHKHKISPNFIKPSNIFLENGKIAFITDIYPPPRSFNPTIHKSNPFDVGFLSPEYLTLGCAPSLKSDLWSLGVLLYFMTTKKLPWNVNNVVVMLKQIQRGAPENLELAPPDIKDIVVKLLQFNPDNRPETHLLIHTKPGCPLPAPPTRGTSSSLKTAADIVVKPLRASPSSPITLATLLPIRRNPAEETSDEESSNGTNRGQINIPQKFTRRLGVISKQSSLSKNILLTKK